MFILFLQQEEEQLLESSALAYSYVPVTSNGADALDRQPSAEENQYQTVGKPATWEVPKRCLTMDQDLGAGHFGKVVKAFMKTENGTKTVAVKMLKGEWKYCMCQFEGYLSLFEEMRGRQKQTDRQKK